MDQILTFLQAAFPSSIAGGGLFGIYLYFRKENAAILEELRKTITAQAAEIATLWNENREQREELRGLRQESKEQHDKDEHDRGKGAAD